MSLPTYAIDLIGSLTVRGNPDVLPAGEGNGVSWDGDGDRLAVAHDTTPFLSWYVRSGTSLTKQSNPSSLPAGNANAVAWTRDGGFLAVAHDTTPFLTVYSRSGTTLTKLADPATLPTGTAYGVAWDKNGDFLAVAHDTSPFVTWYALITSTLLLKLPNPATLPAGSANGVAWDDLGDYLAVAHETSPFVTAYSKSGTTLTKLADPATLPTGEAKGVDWTADGSHLAVAHTTTPFITIFSRSGSTLTKVANPSILPERDTVACSFTREGDSFLTVLHKDLKRYAVPISDVTNESNNWSESFGDGDGSFFDELDEGIESGSGPDDNTTYWENTQTEERPRSQVGVSHRSPNPYWACRPCSPPRSHWGFPYGDYQACTRNDSYSGHFVLSQYAVGHLRNPNYRSECRQHHRLHRPTNPGHTRCGAWPHPPYCDGARNSKE